MCTAKLSTSLRRRDLFALAFFLGIALASCRPAIESDKPYQPRPRGTLTFNQHIAPIIFQNCAGCHRPGQSAPFPLLTYEDVRKRAQQVVEATQTRYMPPWLPTPGHFVGERRLSNDQIGMIAQWAAEGGVAGAPGDLPSLPKFPEGWLLGKPDLIVIMPEPFSLPAEGKDLYRNFVIPIPSKERRYVKAVEFNPGNQAIVHHAFIRFDATRQSRRYDEQDPNPGFSGIHAPATAQPPEGFFLSWQPGKTPNQPPEGFAWPLAAGSDVVLQLHLKPSGKPETIQSQVAFYFADKAPPLNPLKIWLSSFQIDIPLGHTNYVLEDSYRLPADVDVLGILPHAHYLASEMHAFAVLPDQSRTSLLDIPHWDFNWQGDYRYIKPVFLPKGSTIHMRFHYDNSDKNINNPNDPPKRVQYGLQSTDEMGELWLQVLPRQPSDRTLISKDYQARVIQDALAYNQYLLGQNPRDAQAHSGLGKANYFLNRIELAVQSFQQATVLDPKLDEPYYYFGLINRRQGNLVAAQEAFTTAITLNPDNPKAHGNLGMILLELRNYPQAEVHLRKAIALDPDDLLALDSLGIIAFNQGDIATAETHFRAALRLDPSDTTVKQHLDAILQMKRK